MPAKVDDFFEAIRPFTYRNSGGCLLFCYAFWVWLKANNMDTSTFQIIQFDYEDGKQIEYNLKWINGEINDNAKSSPHFAWTYEGVEYDSDGELYGWHSYEKEQLTGLNTSLVTLVDEFCEDALENAAWNSSFRDYNWEKLPHLNEMLGINLTVPRFNIQ